MSQLQLRLDTATAASAAAKADPANEAKASVAVSLWSQLQLDVAGACLDEAKADPTNEIKMRAAMLLSPYSFMFLGPKWFENPGQLNQLKMCKEVRSPVLLLVWPDSPLRHDLLDGLVVMALVQLQPGQRSNDRIVQEGVHKALQKYHSDSDTYKVWGKDAIEAVPLAQL
jgi:hypothetical protein